MLTEKLLLRIRKILWKFRSAQGGNVAIIMALALVALFGVAGIAIDYTRAASVKTKIQAALDSTALALSKEAETDTNAQLQANASKYFSALFDPLQAQDITISASYSLTGGKNLTATASAAIPTSLAGLLGVKTMVVHGTTTVKWGSTRLRVALVLDNTGSMSQSNKMVELKSATQKLLTQLQGLAAVNGDVYVSIIPFVKDVNLGAGNYKANWIDWRDWVRSCRSSCTTPNSTWNGCVTDRGDQNAPNPSNYDTNVVAPNTGIRASLYAAEQYSACPQAAIGLGYNWPAMSTLVNNMVPAGNTNQALGLQVGWMSLVGGGPFTVPSTPPGQTYKNIVVLVTDGLNTQDRWYTVQSQIDARQTKTCTNIKASGITLYTVQISTDGTAVSPLLKNCASDLTKFFYLTSSTQIVSTFSQIGTDFTNLYIAR